MQEISLQVTTSGLVEREQLAMLKKRAMRAGVWFRALTRIDRVLIDLTMKVTQSVRSQSLAKRVVAVASKLEVFLESKIVRATRKSEAVALKLSFLAQNWGNKAAEAWAVDASFARYLAVMELNG